MAATTAYGASPSRCRGVGVSGCLTGIGADWSRLAQTSLFPQFFERRVNLIDFSRFGFKLKRWFWAADIFTLFFIFIEWCRFICQKFCNSQSLQTTGRPADRQMGFSAKRVGPRNKLQLKEWNSNQFELNWLQLAFQLGRVELIFVINCWSLEPKGCQISPIYIHAFYVCQTYQRLLPAAAIAICFGNTNIA